MCVWDQVVWNCHTVTGSSAFDAFSRFPRQHWLRKIINTDERISVKCCYSLGPSHVQLERKDKLNIQTFISKVKRREHKTRISEIPTWRLNHSVPVLPRCDCRKGTSPVLHITQILSTPHIWSSRKSLKRKCETYFFERATPDTRDVARIWVKMFVPRCIWTQSRTLTGCRHNVKLTKQDWYSRLLPASKNQPFQETHAEGVRRLQFEIIDVKWRITIHSRSTKQLGFY